MKHNFSVYADIWDRLLGTHWSPQDSRAQAKYAKAKAVAEERAAREQKVSSLSETPAGYSTATAQ